MKKIILIFITTFNCVANLYSQIPTDSLVKLSPGGLLETVFDNNGNKFKLNDLKVGTVTTNSAGVQKTSTLLCPSGYFNLYFETGSGMEGTSVTETDRRNVICQVFSDISTFITSPLSNAGNTNRVNIWVRDISQVTTNPATSGMLGAATAYYNVPFNATAGFGGIADNEIWKTIQSGTDSYINVISPLGNSSGGTFYHGAMAFNFSNSGINWNTNLSLASSPTNLYDLYSVALHEVTHALGFASLINSNGLSKFGNGYNYYSRYDLFLRNHAGTQNLISNAGACAFYNYNFNTVLTDIAPGGCVNSTGSSDNTICGTAVTYVGSTTVPLYTPNCFEASSSLSHFEDQCFPTPASPYGNNVYFSMSNANGTGPAFTKRHLAIEERLVLCDLGYNVNTTFGLSVNNNFFDYNTTICAGEVVVGTNDGFNSTGNYIYNGNASTPISIVGLLTNDYFSVSGTTTFECLEDVTYGIGGLSATSGNNTIPVFLNTSVAGVHLLRYIPVSQSGKRGNITYVYVYVKDPNCTANGCNMVNNGGFEGPGIGGPLNALNANCWDALSGNPDVFTRFSIQPTSTFHTGVNTNGSVPATDTHNFTPNDNFMGLWAYQSALYGYSSEAIQTTLNIPLIPTKNYVLSFWAKVNNNYGGSNTNVPADISFASYPNFSGPITLYNQNFMSLVPNSINIVPTTVVPADNTWHQYTIPFTFPAGVNHNALAIYYEQVPATTSDQKYVFIDDISLQEQTVFLNLPPILCINQSIADLSIYLSSGTPNGVFTGAGVSLTNGVYSFNASAAGVGNHPITYTYINNVGCSISVSAIINVVNSTINITASASSNNVCASGAVTLTGSGASTYEWQPGALPGSPVLVHPTASTTYVLTGTNANGCKATASVAITVTPLNINIAASQNPLCIGQGLTLTPSGASSYVLQPVNMTGTGPFSINPPPVVPTIYDVTGTDANGCTGTAQITVNVQTCNSCSTNCFSTFGTTLSSSPASGHTYCLNNNLLITGNVIISNSELKIGPGWIITIAPNGSLTILKSHLYSCSDMWQGIVVQNGGRLNILYSLIEDAMVAVDVTGNTQTTSNVFTFSNSTFNRNDVGLFINGYSQAYTPYPFSITNCIFTCRNIPFTSTPAITFDQTATIGGPNTTGATPFTNTVIDNGTYTQAVFLKAPFATGNKPSAGIRLKSVGVTLNAAASSPTYYEFVLGGLANKNIFDNLKVCVDLIGSNFTSYNTTYQNTAAQSKGITSSGVAINATAPTQAFNNRLRVTSPIPNSNFGNKFVDCSRAINTTNYFEHLITYNDIRSSQASSATTLINHKGEYGIKSITNRFKAYNVSNNTIYNIENGVIFDAIVGSLAIPTIPTTGGQYAGQINVDNNTIAPQIGTNAIGSNYVANAIALSNVVNPIVSLVNGLPALVQTANNTITNVYRAISYKNWNREVNSIINSNNIKLVVQPFISNVLQYGINMEVCSPAGSYNSTRNNDISGFGITNSNSYGIRNTLSTRSLVNCNTTTNTYNGIAFVGSCLGTSFTKNSMSVHHYGFALYTNGEIGPQGTLTAPQDNQWTGTNWTGHFKTATINSTSQSSKLYIRSSSSSSAYNPDASKFTNGTIGTDDYNLSGTSPSLIQTTSAPVNLPCQLNVPGGGTGNPPPGFVISRLEQIAQDLAVYLTNVQQTRTITKNELYRMLKTDASLMANSPILQTFYTNSQSNNRKTFDDVETRIATGDISTAAGLNAAVSTTNTVETNHKSFYDLAIKQADGTITTNDSLALATLAYGCPFTDGVVVYQARVLLNVLYDRYMVYPDNCPIQVGSRLGKTNEGETAISDENKFDAVLFPNPGALSFNMATFGLTDGEIEVTISDVTGKQVFKNTLSVANALTLFNLDVKNGIYFVKITNKENTITKKLVIQQ